MIEQAQVDRYVENGTSLNRAIQWINRTVMRESYSVVAGWGAVVRETRAKHGPLWHK